MVNAACHGGHTYFRALWTIAATGILAPRSLGQLEPFVNSSVHFLPGLPT